MEWIAFALALLTGLFAGWKLGSRALPALAARIQELETELAVQKIAAEKEKNMLQSGMEREIALLRENHKTQLASEKAACARMMAEQEKALDLKTDLLRAEFKTLSERIFTEKSGQMKQENNRQLEDLLKPLKEKMAEFKRSVDSSKEKGIEQSARLEQQISRMMEEARRLGSEAGSLAAALKGEQKTQGNWGEMILDDILSRSGLQAGIHYDLQPTLRDSSGKTLRTEDNRMLRPDVIVHYPDGRHVIIDSKVSLTAYAEYMNAEEENSRAEALNRHLRSVRKHVEELAGKDYSFYLEKSGKETADFVLMFIPNESSYLSAMNQLPTLWREAFDKKVLIVSPVNLIALLQLICMAWVRADQDRNQENILKTAGQLLDRVYAFYDDFDEIGRNMERLQKSYNDALGRLKYARGGHSIVNSGEKLRQLGVKLSKNKTLPSRLETAETVQEIPSLPEE